MSALRLYQQVAEASRDLTGSTDLQYEVIGWLSRSSARSHVVHVSSHVADDGVMGTDGGSVEGGSAVDGTSVEHVGVSELSKDSQLSVVSSISGMLSSSFGASS